MATILHIETSTSICSVALTTDGRVIATNDSNLRNAHASQLTLLIQDIMDRGGITYKQLDAVAVAMGPGSYTGLRIGVSTAKGICFAAEKPLIAINTLQLMAAGFMLSHQDFEGSLCPMIDARRMEVYTSLFTTGLVERRATEAKIIDSYSFEAELSQGKIAFFGDGALKCAETITNPNAIFDQGIYNAASNMLSLAEQKFMEGKFEDVAYFEPFYLKDFVATKAKKLF